MTNEAGLSNDIPAPAEPFVKRTERERPGFRLFVGGEEIGAVTDIQGPKGMQRVSKRTGILLWKSEEVAIGLGHRMSPFCNGVSYCFYQHCGASVAINGSLPNLEAAGTALTRRCPYRG